MHTAPSQQKELTSMKDFAPLYLGLRIEKVKMPTGITWPVSYAIIRRMINNNTFGMVRRRADGSPRPHQGWDFYAPIGTPCVAIADGTVVAVRNSGALGLQVIVEFHHDFDGNGTKDRLFAAYTHLSKASVKVGQKVNMGSVVGLTGDSGNAKGMRGVDAHLHFEIRTHLTVGLGLSKRISPLAVFDNLPLRHFMVAA